MKDNNEERLPRFDRNDSVRRLPRNARNDDAREEAKSVLDAIDEINTIKSLVIEYFTLIQYASGDRYGRLGELIVDRMNQVRKVFEEINAMT